MLWRQLKPEVYPSFLVAGVLQKHRHAETDVADDARDDAKARPGVLTPTLGRTVSQRRVENCQCTKTRHPICVLGREPVCLIISEICQEPDQFSNIYKNLLKVLRR
jgi:hypothetical protein